jgi:hypothetical protein
MGAGHILEIDAGNVGTGADARRADHGIAVGLDPADKLLEVRCWQRVSGDDEHRICRQLGDRLEIPQQIV